MGPVGRLDYSLPFSKMRIFRTLIVFVLLCFVLFLLSLIHLFYSTIILMCVCVYTLLFLHVYAWIHTRACTSEGNLNHLTNPLWTHLKELLHIALGTFLITGTKMFVKHHFWKRGWILTHGVWRWSPVAGKYQWHQLEAAGEMSSPVRSRDG